MSMPQIPEEKYRPCLEDTVIDLLESIALEEIALSHLVNAEAEKIQTFLYTIKNNQSCHKNDDFIKFNNSIGKIIDTVIMKEWILLKKLENVMQIDYEPCHRKGDNHCKKHRHCHKEGHDCAKNKDCDCWSDGVDCEEHYQNGCNEEKCRCDEECWEKDCGCGNHIRVKVKCCSNCCDDCHE